MFKKDLNLTRYSSPIIFILFLLSLITLFRLIFSSRGILEYMTRQRFLLERKEKLVQLGQENERINLEIAQLNNRSYQKRVVRDQLGFIADDEYIVYFK